MNKRHLALVAAIAVLVGLAVAATAVRTEPPVTVRCSDVLVGDGIRVIFYVTNRTSQRFVLQPSRLERFDSNQWTKVPDGISSFSKSGFSARNDATLACIIKSLPAGTRLRLVIQSQRGRTGISTFALRVRLRLSGDKGSSLNPFDKLMLFTDPVEVVSDEFLAP